MRHLHFANEPWPFMGRGFAAVELYRFRHVRNSGDIPTEPIGVCMRLIPAPVVDRASNTKIEYRSI